MTQHLKSPDRKPSSKLWVPLAGAAALIVAGAVVFSIVNRGGAEPGSAAARARSLQGLPALPRDPAWPPCRE